MWWVLPILLHPTPPAKIIRFIHHSHIYQSSISNVLKYLWKCSTTSHVKNAYLKPARAMQNCLFLSFVKSTLIHLHMTFFCIHCSILFASQMDDIICQVKFNAKHTTASSGERINIDQNSNLPFASKTSAS